MDDGDGLPSRWNTLRAMRVLDWFTRGGGALASPADAGGRDS